MVPFWLKIIMPITLTLKNIPEDVYRRLKLSAETHRRSLNSEAIVCLEAVLTPNRLPPSERLARARELRSQLGQAHFKVGDIDSVKRHGRP
jgi:plasmid stability protein